MQQVVEEPLDAQVEGVEALGRGLAVDRLPVLTRDGDKAEARCVGRADHVSVRYSMMSMTIDISMSPLLSIASNAG